MKQAPDPAAERGRVHAGPYGSDASYGCNGAFQVRSPVDSRPLFIMASDGAGWDHVSVSRKDRCPTWEEMEYVRSLFFEDGETVVQYSVPREQHISICDTCLHMWRQQGVAILLPPAVMVG